MSDTVEPLVLDLLEWIGPDPRPYAETPEAWRRTARVCGCWQGADDRDLITRHRAAGRGPLVWLSAAGVQPLREHRHLATQITDGTWDGVIADQPRQRRGAQATVPLVRSWCSDE